MTEQKSPFPKFLVIGSIIFILAVCALAAVFFVRSKLGGPGQVIPSDSSSSGETGGEPVQDDGEEGPGLKITLSDGSSEPGEYVPLPLAQGESLTLEEINTILLRLCDATPALGAALVDVQGETVDFAGTLDPFDIKIAAAEWRIVLDLVHASKVWSWPQANQLLARGAYFTVGLEVRFSKHIQTIAQEIPLGQLLTETDNPGGPRGFTGELGMPVLVKDVVQGIAEAKKTTEEAIVQAVQANLLALVRDDPGLAEKCARLMVE